MGVGLIQKFNIAELISDITESRIVCNCYILVQQNMGKMSKFGQGKHIFSNTIGSIINTCVTIGNIQVVVVLISHHQIMKDSFTKY